MRYPGKRYAISVHSSGTDRYEDSEPVTDELGTWTFRYCGQDGDTRNSANDNNGWLTNNLEDGVPVGVMTKQPSGHGYKVWGLAYVVARETDENAFWMRGPVTIDMDLV